MMPGRYGILTARGEWGSIKIISQFDTDPLGYFFKGIINWPHMKSNTDKICLFVKISNVTFMRPNTPYRQKLSGFGVMLCQK